MSRDLTGAVASAVIGGNVPILVFVELDFDSGVARYTNAAYNFSWNGQTWYGVGRLGSIDPIEETGGVEAKGVAMRLSGIDPALVAIAVGDHYQGRACKIYAAPLDANYTVLADPKLIFDGRMDTMVIDIGTTATITVSAESRLVDLERPRVRRYNNADQQAVYPGDLFFEHVEEMVEKVVTWGRG